MVKTDETLADSFTVREAAPQRIERLYAMPEFISQPTIIRENGLIFAGQGSLLTFQKPSDIVTKISKWFPKEYAEAQQTKDTKPFFGRIDLFGPYPSWQDESAAFLTLWKCMPQIAWAQPTQNPFMRRLGDGLPLMAIAARSSGDVDFKQCVYERSGRIPVSTQAELKANQKAMREIGSRVSAVLQNKFTHFLTSNRCNGTGPDDCVLIMWLWSSLSSTDVDLAKAIQALEFEVAPDGLLPPLQKTVDQDGSGEQEGQLRFDEALRKAAFLRAKLTSIIHAPEAWPSHALRATLQQMSAFWLKLNEALKPGWRYYALDYYNEPVNPWQVLSLDGEKNPEVQAAVLEELQRLASARSCDVMDAWLKDRPVLRARFALYQLKDKQALGCVSPNWDWLHAGETKESRDLYQQYFGLLGQLQSGIMHEVLLSELTDYGKHCFDKNRRASQPSLAEICRIWVSEPQTVPFTLKQTRLTLSKSKQFQAKQLQLPEVPPATPSDRIAWLIQLTKGMNAEAQQQMQAFVSELTRRKGLVDAATWWTHPHHKKSVVELGVYMNDERSYPDWFYTSRKVLLLIDGQNLTIVRIPLRFPGTHGNAGMVHVSDLDNDGNLEAWWAESFRQCQGDESDLQRELDCSAKTADMGEIRGESLTYFSNTPKTDNHYLSHSIMPNTVLQAAVMPASAWKEREPCNAAIVGSVLKKKLRVNFQMRGDGDVVDLVCKTHPLYPQRTIVALFHGLKDQRGEHVEYQKGVVVAVIDVRRRRLLNLYRDVVGEDATIRIGAHALQIDTARYDLATNVRAFGVRMNIGYSPRCAEGGWSDFLTLFVEKGKQLKPVLKDLPMSMWRITEGSNGCGYGNEAFTMDNVGLTLSVAPTSSAGWRDLEVTAHHQLESWNGVADVPAHEQKNTQILGKLRWNGKMYSGDYGWVRGHLWPGR